MTRVASFSQSQNLMQGILRNQANLFEAQKQVNTGKKSDEFRGIASQVSTLVGAKALKSRTESYVNSSETISRALNTYDVQLNNMTETAQNLRQNILEAIAQNEAEGFQSLLGESYNIIASTVNTKVGGAYIFAGSQTEVKPLTAESIPDLIALPTAQDGFQNDKIKAKARIGDNIETEYGVLADDISEPLVQAYKDIAAFDASPAGNINGALTTTQRSFLEGMLGQLDSAIKTVQNGLVTNGLKARKLDEVTTQHSDQISFLETFVADIEDVNIAEAITRMTNDQTALEASYRVVGQISRLSLTDFI